MCWRYTMTQQLSLVFSSPVSPIYSSLPFSQMPTYMSLKLWHVNAGVSSICNRDQIRSTNYFYGSLRRRFSRNSFKKALAVMEVHWWHFYDLTTRRRWPDTNFHSSIKFPCDYSRKKVNYLDVQVIVREGKLITDLYVKPTDSHQYLDPSSCHPYHCTKSISYIQALRVNWICSENVSLDLRHNKLEEWLIKRNYNSRVVRKTL